MKNKYKYNKNKRKKYKKVKKYLKKENIKIISYI